MANRLSTLVTTFINVGIDPGTNLAGLVLETVTVTFSAEVSTELLILLFLGSALRLGIHRLLESVTTPWSEDRPSTSASHLFVFVSLHTL
jgi:hypothetical protein